MEGDSNIFCLMPTVAQIYFQLTLSVHIACFTANDSIDLDLLVSTKHTSHADIALHNFHTYAYPVAVEPDATRKQAMSFLIDFATRSRRAQ